jgi:hypothetical protein
MQNWSICQNGFMDWTSSAHWKNCEKTEDVMANVDFTAISEIFSSGRMT